MNNAEDNQTKVVDLKQRQAVQSVGDRLGELLKLVRGIALKRVNALVNLLFENVDDALFDLAERAESNATQTQFFDGMREVRKKRQLVERLFQEELGKIFAEFADGKLKPLRPEVGGQSGGSGLSLVDDQELEESLAISSMVSKAESRLARPLFQVNQRLSVINGGAPVEDASNPVGPAPLCHAFRQAVREFDLNVHVKLIIYKLFDRYVMAGLEPLYDEVNNELVRAGVLPQIRPPALTGGRTPTGASHGTLAHAAVAAGDGGATQASGHAAPAAAYDPVAAELQMEMYNTLRGLLASRHPSPGETAYAGAAMAAPNLSPTDLLSALTILQGQTLAVQSQASGLSDAAAAVQQIKQELIDQVHKLGGNTRDHHVSSADEDTIDLVGMLFEYILQDRNLPAQIQALLGRLQIPYLKIAILDKHLFAQKTHPARRLLDALAQAGIGWSEESDRDQRLVGQIRKVVEAILTEFDDDMAIFDRELGSFELFLDQHRRRAELAEQRTAEAVRGREKLQTARRDAAREILARIGARELPSIVHHVLSRPWANYLVLTLLRQGEDSDEWRNALRFADEFIWSSQPKHNDAERARLRALLPQLARNLRQGLGTVAYHENDIRDLMQELSQFYQRLLNGEAVELKTAQDVIAAQAPPIEPEASGDAAQTATPAPVMTAAATQSPVEEIVLTGGSLEPEAPPQPVSQDDEYLRMARELKVGTWIESVDEQGNRERTKLSWISPISSKYLFVNRRGLKVCDKTLYVLADELRRGISVILEEVPLFDRALDAIVERLRQAHGGAKGETDGA